MAESRGWDGAMKEVFEMIAEVLEDLLTKGFALPLHVTIIGANGTMMYCTYSKSAAPEGGLDLTPLVDHHVDRGIKMPINIVFVDARGDAARFVLAPGAAAKSADPQLARTRDLA